MKKIPTVFVREYENHHVANIINEFTSEEAKEAFINGKATIKYDGSCCAVIDGELYKRYDAKKGKKPPQGAIPCCEADPITGHHPHWVKVDENNPGFERLIICPVPDKRLEWARASLDTAYGTIVSGWFYEGDEIVYEFEIPVSAQVFLGNKKFELEAGKYNYRFKA